MCEGRGQREAAAAGERGGFVVRAGRAGEGAAAAPGPARGGGDPGPGRVGGR